LKEFWTFDSDLVVAGFVNGRLFDALLLLLLIWVGAELGFTEFWIDKVVVWGRLVCCVADMLLYGALLLIWPEEAELGLKEVWIVENKSMLDGLEPICWVESISFEE